MEELERKTVAEFKSSSKTPIVVVLDNIRSMHNVGSVFRTADAFLCEAVCLAGFTPQPPHRDIHKTALGATETVDWSYYPQTIQAIRDLKDKGYLIYAIEQVAQSTYLNDFHMPASSPLAIVFGNEVSGVGDDVLALCDGCIEIPQIGMKHSLNISVAAGVVLWELFKQNRENAGRL